MTQSQFSVSWDAHKKNICTGLSTLQQNGEFVDMTLAADGHMVKVHQVIMALASPYLKNIITSTECSHPVIFLNNISYQTLSAILEYIYTGEVVVPSENMKELVVTAKALHIKGLSDMEIHKNLPDNIGLEDTDYTTFGSHLTEIKNNEDINESKDNIVENKFMDECAEDSEMNDYEITITDAEPSKEKTTKKPEPTDLKNCVMQYTVSNQGSLQMILNRFMYYLKYSNRDGTRQWRCVDYVTYVKCPAHVFTKNNVVVQRLCAHTHPFHDKKIVKKVQNSAVFSALQDAELQGQSMKARNSKAQND